jgi:myosin heavy subunit
VGGEFRRQLAALVAELERTRPHYVRCVNPNGRRAAGAADRAAVLLQLRCGGVVEAARAARAGFPARCPLAHLLARFRPLVPPDHLHHASFGANNTASDTNGGTAAPAIAQMMRDCGIAEWEYRLGRTRAFLRAGVLDRLEARLAAGTGGAALRLQVAARARRARLRLRVARLWAAVGARPAARRDRTAYVEFVLWHRAEALAASGRALQARLRRLPARGWWCGEGWAAAIAPAGTAPGGWKEEAYLYE